MVILVTVHYTADDLTSLVGHVIVAQLLETTYQMTLVGHLWWQSFAVHNTANYCIFVWQVTVKQCRAFSTETNVIHFHWANCPFFKVTFVHVKNGLEMGEPFHRTTWKILKNLTMIIIFKRLSFKSADRSTKTWRGRGNGVTKIITQMFFSNSA